MINKFQKQGLRSRRSILSTIKKLPLWVYPLVISLLLFMPVRYVYFNGDGVEYMSQALNVYNGIGLVMFDQTTPLPSRVFFPMYMSLVFHLFGPSELVVFLFLRIFYVFNTLLIYFLGPRLFGKAVGLIASLLALTSFSLSEWQTIINLDYMLPFFMLLTMLLLHLGFEQKRRHWFILAGVAMSAGFLLKETAIVIFMLPGLLWLLIPNYRNRSGFVGFIIATCTIFVLIGLWFGYVSLVITQPDNLLGSQGKSVAASTTSELSRSALISQISKFLFSLITYYQKFLVPNFFFAPLFVAAWLYLGYSAFWGKSRHPSRVLIVWVMPFLPQMIFQGMFGFRASQGMIIFFLCYIALAQFLWRLANLCHKYWVSHFTTYKVARAAGHWLPYGLILAVLWVQFSERQVHFEGRPLIEIHRVGRGNMIDHIRRFNTPTYLLQEDKTWITVIDWGTEVGQWMHDHIPEGSAVLASNLVRRTLYWKTQGTYPFYQLPRRSTGTADLQLSDEAQLAPQKSLFFYSQTAQDILETPIDTLWWHVITEEDLFVEIRSRSIDYVVLGNWENFYLAYLMQSPAFVLVADFGEVQIFRVIRTNLEPIPFRTHVLGDTVDRLQKFKRLYPAKYSRFQAEFLQDTMGLSLAQQKQLLQGEFPSIAYDYALTTFFSDLRARQAAELRRLITVAQKKIRFDPENPWPYIFIGQMHEALNEYDPAIAAYRQATAVAPNEARYLMYLGDAYFAKGLLAQNQDNEAYHQAIEAYRQALILEPDRAEICDALIEALLIKGDQYLEEDLLAEVIAVYKQIIELDPDVLAPYWKLAGLYETLNQTDRAVDVYQRVIAQRPEAAPAYLHLGQIYENQDELEKAIGAYKTAIELDPTVSGAHQRLGNLYVSLNQTEEAIALYRKAARRNLKAAWPHLELGKLYLNQVE